MRDSRRSAVLMVMGIFGALFLGFYACGIWDRAAAQKQSTPMHSAHEAADAYGRELDQRPAAVPSAPIGRAGGGATPSPPETSRATNPRTAASLSLQRLEAVMNAQDFPGALELAEQLLRHTAEGNERDEIDLIRARLLSSVGRGRDAYDALDSLLSVARDPDILQQVAARYYIVARNEGILVDAIRRQEGRLASARDDPAMLRVMAQLYEYAQDTENELRIRKHLQGVDASNENLARIAEVQRTSGNIEAASATVAVLAAVVHPDAAAHVFLRQAQAEHSAGASELAAATAQRALALPKLSDSMTFRLAHVLKDAGNADLALAEFARIAEQSESQEARDRSILEICRIRAERGHRLSELAEILTNLMMSPVSYVQEHAAQLRTTLK